MNSDLPISKNADCNFRHSFLSKKGEKHEHLVKCSLKVYIM